MKSALFARRLLWGGSSRYQHHIKQLPFVRRAWFSVSPAAASTSRMQEKASPPSSSTLGGEQSYHSHWSKGNKALLTPCLLAAAGLGLAWSTGDEKTKAKTEASSIDWNEVFKDKGDNDDNEEEEEEEDQDHGADESSKGGKKAKSCCGGDNHDEDDNEEEKYEIPPYIAEIFRKDLGNSLNHHAPLSVEATNLLRTENQYPVQQAELTMAPHVPPPCNRSYPVHLVVDMFTLNKKMRIKGSKTYECWPFAFFDQRERKMKYGIPGPFIRARVGDILQVNHTNKDESGMAHSVDFHSVCGPGGGSPTTFAEQDETRTGAYRLMKPGLYIYHCAASPIPLHIHNGMFGLILVEPEEGLPPVDKEFYVMQHEMYLVPEDGNPNAKEYEHDYDAATREIPSHVLFNGRENSMIDKPLVVKQDETVRVFFGNAGPNLVSSFHIIGTVFDKVYREGDVLSHPAKAVQTTLVPAGGAAVVELKMQVPGNFAIVDHSINRIDKGAVGFMKVKGKPRPDIYDSTEPPRYCPGCKTHN